METTKASHLFTFGRVRVREGPLVRVTVRVRVRVRVHLQVGLGLGLEF